LNDKAAETSVDLVAMSGLAAFYGLERAAKFSRNSGNERNGTRQRAHSRIAAVALHDLLLALACSGRYRLPAGAAPGPAPAASAVRAPAVPIGFAGHRRQLHLLRLHQPAGAVP